MLLIGRRLTDLCVCKASKPTICAKQSKNKTHILTTQMTHRYKPLHSVTTPPHSTQISNAELSLQLCNAARRGDNTIVAKLLDEGADTNATSDDVSWFC